MSLIQAAQSQVSRYGTKGTAQLERFVSAATDTALMTKSVTSDPVLIPLLAKVHDYGNVMVDGALVRVNTREVEIVPDVDFDGAINPQDNIFIDGVRYSIDDIDTKRVGGVIATLTLRVKK